MKVRTRHVESFTGGRETGGRSVTGDFAPRENQKVLGKGPRENRRSFAAGKRKNHA